MKFEIPSKPHYSPNLSSLMEGEPITAVCRVIPLISPEGHTKGFILKSVIGEVGKKKEKEEIKHKTMVSFTEDVEV